MSSRGATVETTSNLGGVPKPNWSGLKDPNPTNVEPKQQRPTGINSAAKSQHYRTTEMEVKFSRDKDLLTFQRKVTKHLVDNGLDTIAYLPDPSDPTQVISVITGVVSNITGGKGKIKRIEKGKTE